MEIFVQKCELIKEGNSKLLLWFRRSLKQKSLFPLFELVMTLKNNLRSYYSIIVLHSGEFSLTSLVHAASGSRKSNGGSDKAIHYVRIVSKVKPDRKLQWSRRLLSSWGNAFFFFHNKTHSPSVLLLRNIVHGVWWTHPTSLHAFIHASGNSSCWRVLRSNHRNHQHCEIARAAHR